MEIRYPFQKSEKEIYQFWEKENFFQPKFSSKKGKFCIIMPPPNANASLHIGHAVFVTLEDIMIRYQRMKQKATLWVPGADHAGFETQVVFERELEKQGKTRFQFSPEVLYKMIWDFTQKNKKIMEAQLRRLGASCDWSREKFTLDKEAVKVVSQTFEKLFQDNLIYRGQRVINWCSYHQTSLSDLEVLYQKRKTKLYFIKYPFLNSKKFLVIATTRPETMLADVALAVNPNDKRYQNLLKKKIKLILPLKKRLLPLITHSLVDPNFGTGVVKVTPAHDFQDFEIAKSYKLPIISVIDRQGRMTKEAGPEYFGKTVKEAREKIIEELKKQNFLEKEENYFHLFPLCYKCKKEIQPLISEQWFLKMKPLAQKAIKAVKEGKIKFLSKRFEKIYFNWLKNIRDWNISRQIVWGIEMPIWYCQEKRNEKCQKKEGIIISLKKVKRCPWCFSPRLLKEKDTFDTWFSSAQWPFIVLNFPRGRDYRYFYPTSVMETGWDILFFWVARMIMLSLYRTGKVPFRYIYLHGLVRDEQRQKMSKSKGNVIDPLGVIELYGADALRGALVFGSSGEKDIIISERKIIAQQRFVTKIWNASRFVLLNLGEDFNPKKIKLKEFFLGKEDKLILKELNKVVKNTTQDLEKFRFHRAFEKIYKFFWFNFCDQYLEKSKKILYNENPDPQRKKMVQMILYTVLLNSLKLLHPFLPFVTEAIYQKLPHKPKKALIIEQWPSG